MHQRRGSVLELIPDPGVRGVARIGQLPEPDHSLALQRHRIAPHERFLALIAGDERAIGALVHQRSGACAASMRAWMREIRLPLHHDVVVVGRDPSSDHPLRSPSSNSWPW